MLRILNLTKIYDSFIMQFCAYMELAFISLGTDQKDLELLVISVITVCIYLLLCCIAAVRRLVCSSHNNGGICFISQISCFYLPLKIALGFTIICK